MISAPRLMAFAGASLLMIAVLRDHSPRTIAATENTAARTAPAARANLKNAGQSFFGMTAQPPRAQRVLVPTPLNDEASPKAMQESMQTLSAVLFDVSHPETSPAELVQRLNREGLQPRAGQESNKFTGSTITIQTDNALPGTRYFSAEYVTDQQGHYNPQFISFEMKPGTSVQTVIRTLESAGFGSLVTPKFKEQNFVTWDLENNMNLSIQTLTKRDIDEGAPGKARSMDDIGTVVVAVVADLPGHEDE